MSEQAANRDENEIKHLRKLREIHVRNLRLLEKQSAQYGINAPVNIIYEIESRKREIANLEARLAQYNDPDAKLADRIESDSRTLAQLPKNTSPKEVIEYLCNQLDFLIISDSFYSYHNQLLACKVKAPRIQINLPNEFPIIAIVQQDVTAELINNVAAMPKLMSMDANFGLVLTPDCFPTDQTTPLLKTRNSSGPTNIQSVVQQLINQFIRPAMKFDLIALGQSTLESIYTFVNPQVTLLGAILREVELTRFSPFMAGGANLVDTMFFGREGEIKEIAEAITKTSVVITCGRRMGKTTLLNRLAKSVLLAREQTSFFLNCQPIHNYADFLSEMASVWNRPDIPFDSSNPNSFALVAQTLSKDSQPAIFLFDEIDELFKYDQQHDQRLFKQFRSLSLSGQARFIVTGERSVQASLHDPGSPMFNFFGLSVRLSFLELPAVNKLIIQPLSDLQIEFSEPLQITDMLFNATSGHPYLVQRLCQGVVEAISRQGVRLINPDHIELVLNDRAYQEDYFETVWGQAPRLARIITMIAGEGGLTMKQLQTILQQHDLQPSLREIKNALDILDLYSVMIRKQGRYHFIATAFPDMMRRSYGEDIETNIMLQCEEYRWEQQASNALAH